MHGVISHLARRGMEAGADMHKEYQNFDYKMPTYGIVVLVSTAILYIVGMSIVEYSFGRMIPALIMVETPQAILFEPLKNDPDAALDSKVEQELLLVKQEPITASFRKTLKHLRAKAGRAAHLRGVRVFFVYSAAMSMCTSFFSAIPVVPRFVAPIVASLLLANVSVAWTHIVISENNNKAWYKRVPSFKVWKKIAGPTAFLAIAEQLAVALPVAMAYSFGLHNINHETAKNATPTEKHIMVGQMFAIMAVGFLTAVFVVIPANVALTRVQASLLSDDLETIVPFDRSFSGKVIPEIVGGTGVVGIRDALTTFDWAARIRLVLAYVKVFFMQIALSVLFLTIMVSEIFLIVGFENLNRLSDHIQKEGNTIGEITID